MDSSVISVKLDAFDGPLDLLLHLIEKNKIDIFDIPIVQITEQYLKIIAQMESQGHGCYERFFGDGGNAVKDKVQNASSGRGDRGG